MISSENLIFKNLQGKFPIDVDSSIARGDWVSTLEFLSKGRDWIISEVKKSGLKGRGGAGFPTAVKWSFMPKNHSKPSYMIVNADESEPGACKDRDIIRFEPHKLLEGCVISSFAVGARYCYIYIRGEFYHESLVLEHAIKEAYQKQFIGKNLFGLNYDLDVFIHRGAGAYICGEETALLESIEGKKGQPRLKPPFPANFGLYSSPTNINNVESLAVVSSILKRGGGWFASMGTKQSSGSKIFSILGHVNQPVQVEEELGVSLRFLVDHYAQGVVGGWENLKAVIPGGASLKMLTPEVCQSITMDFESLKAAGSGLGVGCIIVMNKTTDVVNIVNRISKFFMHESCGKCTPCREGTAWMYKILSNINSGSSDNPNDISELLDLSNKIGANSICGLADAASWAVQGLIENFKDDINAKIIQDKNIS